MAAVPQRHGGSLASKEYGRDNRVIKRRDVSSERVERDASGSCEDSSHENGSIETDRPAA